MRAAQEAVTHGHKLGIVLQKDPSVDEPGPDDLHKIGTTVTRRPLYQGAERRSPPDLPGRAAIPRASTI